jgi:hypothetical protein
VRVRVRVRVRVIVRVRVSVFFPVVKLKMRLGKERQTQREVGCLPAPVGPTINVGKEFLCLASGTK